MAIKVKKLILLETVKIQKDRVFDTFLVSKFICKLMRHGKKEMIETIVLKAAEFLKREGEASIDLLLYTGVDTFRPTMVIRLKRLGKRRYDVPFPLKTKSQFLYSLTKFVKNIRNKGKGKITLYTRIINGFSDGYMDRKPKMLDGLIEHLERIKASRVKSNHRGI